MNKQSLLKIKIITSFVLSLFLFSTSVFAEECSDSRLLSDDFDKPDCWHQEKSIKLLETREGYQISENLVERRKSEGEQFSMPELEAVVSNMLNIVKKMSLYSHINNEEQSVLSTVEKRLLEQKERGFPYRATVELLVKANIVRDYIYNRLLEIPSRKGIIDGSLKRMKVTLRLEEHFSPKQYLEVNGVQYAPNLTAIYYFDSFTVSEIMDINLNPSTVEESSRWYERLPYELWNLHLALEQQIVFIPTFDNPPPEFYIHAALYPVFPLRLGHSVINSIGKHNYSTGALLLLDVYSASIKTGSCRLEIKMTGELVYCHGKNKSRILTFSDPERNKIILDSIFSSVRYAKNEQYVPPAFNEEKIFSDALTLFVSSSLDKQSAVDMTQAGVGEVVLSAFDAVNSPQKETVSERGGIVSRLYIACAAQWVEEVSKSLVDSGYQALPGDVLEDIYRRVTIKFGLKTAAGNFPSLFTPDDQ
ncbi:hypothetical protein EOPP23_18775 [Endozoicomonas sp. OPT23]|uniref:hypothetical protein n=1 Tax=Endozoicomonas sp. OPT23 TaxID=2072845 RepID=UPI00129A7248|nr:hypothetical protein [Endozoicomonas sp. OPT23]MRI35024.1 hypothetical protein [Endozoicomonas sp. OPT23]